MYKLMKRECQSCGETYSQCSFSSNDKNFCDSCLDDMEVKIESRTPPQLTFEFDREWARIHFVDKCGSEVNIVEVPVVECAENTIDISPMRLNQTNAEYVADILAFFSENGYLPSRANIKSQQQR